MMEQISKKQKEVLLRYMQDYSLIATRDIGHLGGQGDQFWKAAWITLSKKLNEYGTPRSVDSWTKVT